MVTWTIEAVFRDGVFRPLAPVALPEDACVTLVVEGEPVASPWQPFGQMDESDWVHTAWAGSLGEVLRLAAIERDEG